MSQLTTHSNSISRYFPSLLLGLKFAILSSISIFSLDNVNAQATLAIGEWQSHLPYYETKVVTQSEEKVYYATQESIMIFDKEDGTIDFLTRIEGLSQTGIRTILYDDANEQLIIAYKNNVLDFVTKDAVFTITDIRDKADILGDKTIYDMYIKDGEVLYLATGFGLVEFDLQNLEFGFTMDISQQVAKVDGNGDGLVIVLDTPQGGQVGAYQLDLTSTNVPGFFPEWTPVQNGLPIDYDAQDVLVNEDGLFLATTNEVFYSENGSDFDTVYHHQFDLFNIIFIESTPEGIMIGMQKENPSFTGKSKLIFLEGNKVVKVVDDCIRNMRDAILDKEGRIFFCDVWNGISYLESVDGPCVPIVVNSPYDRDARDISIQDGIVYVASGGIRENFGDSYGRDGMYILEDGDWTNINNLTRPFMSENDVIQVFKVAAKPTGDKVFFASFWAGIVQYDVATGTLETLYNRENSSLQFQDGDDRVRISGLAFDQDNTLWISNFRAKRPLCALSDDGNWYSFAMDRSDVGLLAEIDVDDSGIVWVAVGGTAGGVLIYDKGPDLADPTDDLQRYLNVSNSEIPSNTVNTVKVDRSGSVWVGTGAGVVVFECGGSAMDESCLGNKRKVQEDNITAFLLESEDVLSIGVDGADRKWFGTRNGIFVQSPDGEEKIANYNVNNSPLFDNTIRSLEFDPESGQMYIGTDMGMQSIRTETTGARNVHEQNVIAFPNPVRPEYRGPIAIKGLAQDAEVRITDIDGHLVSKTRALGGQAIWDGYDLNGNDVASGVYLVFSSSTDLFADTDSYVTKILVVR